jgi:prophage regulatory protein
MQTPSSPDVRVRLSPKQVAARLGVSRRTLDGLLRAGKFPKPVRFNQRVVRWDLEEVDAFLATLENARRSA